MRKVIVHIDLNCFFVQCEVLTNPSLKGKPIAIGREGSRGVISTASYEARKYNVNSAMPVSTAKRLCPNLILVDSHYRLYEEYSRKFFDYLKERFPILEIASIDECYIDMTNEINGHNYEDFLFDLQMSIYRCTNLKCSIGCSYNKFLAKMASDMKKPLGLTLIDKEDIPKLVWPLKISDFYGIGKKTAPKLMEANILTIGDLAKDNTNEVKEILGSSYQTYKDHANGIASDFVDSSSFDPKSISSEETFANNEEDYDEIVSMIKKCCKQVHQELIEYKKIVYSISIKWRTPSFVTKSRRKSLSKPTDELYIIEKTALDIFDDVYDRKPLRLIGVCLEKISDKEVNKIKTKELIEKLNTNNEIKLFTLDDLKDENIN